MDVVCRRRPSVDSAVVDAGFIDTSGRYIGEFYFQPGIE